MVLLTSAFCGPCRSARAVLRRVIDAEPRVGFAEVDADSDPALTHALTGASGPVSTPMAVIVASTGDRLGVLGGVPRLAAVRSTLERLLG